MRFSVRLLRTVPQEQYVYFDIPDEVVGEFTTLDEERAGRNWVNDNFGDILEIADPFTWDDTGEDWEIEHDWDDLEREEDGAPD